MTSEMGAAKVGEDDPDWITGGVLRAARVDIGNPHLVLHVPQPDDVDLEALGRHVNDLVAGGINVEVIAPGPEPDEITMRVYERGVGLTQACGTGACASAAAAVEWGLVANDLLVNQPGGIAAIQVGDPVLMTLPVVYVATIDWPNP
jgi:diaminopimelate epimerase